MPTARSAAAQKKNMCFSCFCLWFLNLFLSPVVLLVLTMFSQFFSSAVLVLLVFGSSVVFNVFFRTDC